MEKYILKQKKKKKKIVNWNISSTSGYQFKPNIRNPKLIKINCLTIDDKNITTPILCKKMESSFRKLASFVLQIMNDEEASSGDVLIALTEVTKQKSIILTQYKEYLKKKEYDHFLKRLKVLEMELKEKQLFIGLKREEIEERHIR